MSKNQIIVSINTSGADLLKLANGRTAQKGAAELEIFRRVEKRHMQDKFVSPAMQKVANRVADRGAEVQVKAEVKRRTAEVASAKVEHARLARINAAWATFEKESGITMGEFLSGLV